MSLPDYKLFPRVEYAARWKRAKELMEKEDFDALLVTEPLNYHYFSGASPSFSYARWTFVVLPKIGNPTLMAHRFVEESTRRETWIEDVRIYEELNRPPFDTTKKVFEELGLSNGKIGVELGYEQRLGMTFKDFLSLKQTLPKANFVDGSHIFWKLRMVKSDAEAELHRKNCKITSEAYDECFNTIKQGMTEKEVEKIFFNAITARGGTRPWCFINSGPYNYPVISGNPTDHRLEKGNVLWIDGGCTLNGYWSDFCRIASISSPSEKQEKTNQTMLELTEICVDMVKPGVKVSGIAKACDSELKKRGLKLTFRAGRIGHGIGLMLTEPPHVASFDDTVLETGMIITIEPGFVTDYGVFQAEQNVLVTKVGHEVLSVASTEMRQI